MFSEHRRRPGCSGDDVLYAVSPAGGILLYLFDNGLTREECSWFLLIDQVDWDSALVLQRSVVNPLGLYDLGRRPRPVTTAYKDLVDRFAAEPLLPYGCVLGFTADGALREEARSPGVSMEVGSD